MMNNKRAHIECQNISFTYAEESMIFDQLNLSVYDKEFVAILGPSGSGKSTLFRLLTGLEQPQQGKIVINGREERNRLGLVGYMPQQDLLLPWRTVLENGVLPLELKGWARHEARREVKEHLQAFGIAGTEALYPHQLSGGMKQRLSFLRTILGGNDVLLLDEPFSALDSMTRFMMQEWLLEQWNQWKKTIIFITHDVEEALFLADRILLMTESPVGEMEDIQVPLGRPRTLEDRSDPRFVQLKQELFGRIRAQVSL